MLFSLLGVENTLQMNILTHCLIKNLANEVYIAFRAGDFTAFFVLQNFLAGGTVSEALLTILYHGKKFLHLATLRQRASFIDLVRLFIELCKQLSNSHLESAKCLVFNRVEPVLVGAVLLVPGPVSNVVRVVVEHAVPELLVTQSRVLVSKPQVHEISTVNWLLLRKQVLVFLRLRVDVILQLQKLLLVDSERR